MRVKPLLFHFSAEFVASSTGFLRVDTETQVRSGCPDFEMIDLAVSIQNLHPDVVTEYHMAGDPLLTIDLR